MYSDDTEILNLLPTKEKLLECEKVAKLFYPPLPIEDIKKYLNNHQLRVKYCEGKPVIVLILDKGELTRWKYVTGYEEDFLVMIQNEYKEFDITLGEIYQMIGNKNG